MFSYISWQHDLRTKCRTLVGGREHKAVEYSLPRLDADPTRSRSKFSFLIERWGNQVQTSFLHNPF